MRAVFLRYEQSNDLFIDEQTTPVNGCCSYKIKFSRIDIFENLQQCQFPTILLKAPENT